VGSARPDAASRSMTVRPRDPLAASAGTSHRLMAVAAPRRGEGGVSRKGPGRFQRCTSTQPSLRAFPPPRTGGCSIRAARKYNGSGEALRPALAAETDCSGRKSTLSLRQESLGKEEEM